jgi:hypothetical protein
VAARTGAMSSGVPAVSSMSTDPLMRAGRTLSRNRA